MTMMKASTGSSFVAVAVKSVGEINSLESRVEREKDDEASIGALDSVKFTYLTSLFAIMATGSSRTNKGKEKPEDLLVILFRAYFLSM
ncbi:hypothetical protein Syun_028048 [Stephania yunnanensis]|uniref:Uncharacterized protein n=1 Tax=Stephania yunnanensis TaxID=152371 RepID=A0AAP0ELV0_9MAGN